MTVPRDTWGTIADGPCAGWKVIVPQEVTGGERYVFLFPPAPSTDVFNHWAADEAELEGFFDPDADPAGGTPTYWPGNLAGVVWDGVAPPEDDPRVAPRPTLRERLSRLLRRHP